MITTRNRRGELHRTLSKLRELRPKPDEVLVCADGCADDTVAMVRTDFPECILIENSVSRGSVFSRDRMLRQATGEIVVSLDDDSYPIDPDFLPQLKKVLARHPEAAVITFVELRGEDATPCGPGHDLSQGRYVAAYPNCAAAMRRAEYGSTGTFSVSFGHMYEEPDYALQCYAAGRGVWFEPSLRVRHHLTMTSRQPVGRHHLNARNEFWSVLQRCPWPWLPLLALYRVLRQFQFACAQGFSWVVREPRWWWMALVRMPEILRQRRPVRWVAYRTWLQLNREVITHADALREKLRFSPAKISQRGADKTA
jgi:GT2 family glycosyltransferase